MDYTDFNRAVKQVLAENHNHLPGVITDYDKVTQRASVKITIKRPFRDTSDMEFPKLHGVPVVCPSTAYAGMQFPVAVGDKVWLHFQDRAIAPLMNISTEGLSDISAQSTNNAGINDLSFAVAYLGMSSWNSAHGTDGSVHIFNNKEKDTESRFQLQEDGTVLVENKNAKYIINPEGSYELSNESSSIKMSKEGKLEITAPQGVVFNTPSITTTGSITADKVISSLTDVVAVAVSLLKHIHIVPSGSSAGPTTPPQS